MYYLFHASRARRVQARSLFYTSAFIFTHYARACQEGALARTTDSVCDGVTGLVKLNRLSVVAHKIFVRSGQTIAMRLIAGFGTVIIDNKTVGGNLKSAQESVTL